MNRLRQELPAIAGATLVAAGIALAVLAVALWRLPGDAAYEDRLLVGARTLPADVWQGNRSFQLAGSIAGGADDAAFRRAIAMFRRGRALDVGATKGTDQIVSSVLASAQLAVVERSTADARRRSQAANMQGILVAEEAVFDPDGGPRVALAAGAFRRALKLDPANEAAKLNLELLLGLTRSTSGGSGESTGGFGGFGKDSGGGNGGAGY